MRRTYVILNCNIFCHINAYLLLIIRSVHSLLLRFTDDTFDPELAATIGESHMSACEHYR